MSARATTPLPPASPPARAGARACLGIAAVAGAFTLAVLLLLFASHVQSRRADPLESPALKALREDLKRLPQDSRLHEEYRRLDLLARRAYIDATTFRSTGSWLLLAEAITLLTALKCHALLAPRPLQAPSPGTAARPEDPAIARWLVGAAGLAAAGGLLLAALASRSTYQPGAPPTAVRGPAGPAAAVGPSASQPAAREDRPLSTRSLPDPTAARADVPPDEVRLRQWPGFRGPDGGARAAGDPYPTDWDGESGRNVLWRAGIPRPGFGSPAVWGDRVFVTGADESAREIFCFDARDGRLLWRHQVAGVPDSSAAVPEVTPDTGHAASSPATDGRRVFALFSNGDLVAVDFDGRSVWGLNLGVPDNPYGHASSPLVWRDLLIVQYDHRLQARVLALAAATGTIVWEQFRETDVTWSSPILIARDGREELVLNGNPTVAAYDPATGAELWSIPCLAGEVAVSPAYGEGLVFAANDHARLAAIAPAGGPRVLWEHGADLPEVSSPLAVGGRVYVANGAGVLTCLDARAGDVLWRREFDNGFYASPVLAGGLVYLVDRSGVTRIFEPAGEYRERASPALGASSTVTPAFSAGRIFLRGERELVCVGAAGAAGGTR